MSESQSPSLSKQSGPSSQGVHDESVAAVGKLLSDFGWTVHYDPIAIAPSGSPVHADLKGRSPDGADLLFEVKIGDSNSYLPLSAYAQAAQLVGSGAPAIFFTNMMVSDSLAELFQKSKIPIIKTAPQIEQSVLFEGLKSAAALNPAISLRFSDERLVI